MNRYNQKTEKQLWESLAKANPRYFIFTDFGKKITEAQFRQSGLADYERFILKDPLLKSRGSLLDLGCGLGRLTEFMAADFQKVFGVDISGSMIRAAKERLGNLKNTRLFETDGVTFPLADKSIDVVFSYIVFQHIKSRPMIKKNFRQVARVLKPKGIFKVLVKTSGLEYLDRWWGGVILADREIQALCLQAGLNISRSEPVFGGRTWLWLTKAAPHKAKTVKSDSTKPARFASQKKSTRKTNPVRKTKKRP